ncbi:MAG: TIGR03557 family F420-dependent LLM class oxidoreductase [Nitrososphaerota archaeon]|nr:TIGR03557 family F420-dependent LLM class oxidoreductase [Nitrososphaerota archaeon]
MRDRIRFGYRAVAEQYGPSQLMEFAVLAEAQGFEFVSISDHFHPWFHQGGHAAFAWSWIASAAERTKRVRLGTGVTTPINRFHPAIVAQAFATMGAMYPGRVYLGLGTGEAMNEVPVGQRWPPFRERVARVEESIEIIRGLWREDFLTYRGKYFSVQGANIYDKPTVPVPIYVAASGATMAEVAGGRGDGLYTTPAREEKIKGLLLPAVRKGAEESGRRFEDIHRMILCNVSWNEDYDKALDSIKRWRATAAPGSFEENVSDPRELDRIGEKVPMEELTWRWTVCTDLEQVTKRVDDYVRMGFDEIEIRSASPNEKEFIERFGRQVLPGLREKYGGA